MKILVLTQETLTTMKTGTSMMPMTGISRPWPKKKREKEVIKMEIKLTRTAGPFGDECSIYDVTFTHNSTVSDLIDYVRQKKGDWGYVDVYSDKKYRLSYSYGNIITDNIPDAIKDMKISKMNAYGGWSRLDYNIHI